MKLKSKYSVGITSVVRVSDVLDERGRVVGEIHAHHPNSGWKGNDTTYYFMPGALGMELGLQQSRDRTQKGAFAKAQGAVKERLCRPVMIGDAARFLAVA